MSFLKNRSLQVKMVKDGEGDETTVAEEVGQFEIKAEVVADKVEEILKMIGVGVLTYVLADALRQIAIERARHE